MPPKITIHCIRHAQGHHNIPGHYHLRDPALTELGQQQCHDLRANLPFNPADIKFVAASPMRRTLETAHLVLGDDAAPPQINGNSNSNGVSQTNGVNGVKRATSKIIALPDAQETSDANCDIGSPLPDLQAFCSEFAWNVDLSLVNEDWIDKSLNTRFGPESWNIATRAKEVRRWIRNWALQNTKDGEQEVEVVLVTHGGFLHYFANDWEGAADGAGTGWKNTEVRSYQFVHPSNGGGDDKENEAQLTEILASRTRRGKQGPMKGRKEQEILFVKAMEGWEAKGLDRPDRLGDWRGRVGIYGIRVSGEEGRRKEGDGARDEGPNDEEEGKVMNGVAH